MLPEMQLDDQSFEEIVRGARKKIARIYPEWTDYNEHDPGITFLELLAFMQELQQFQMDQTGPEIEKAYLALLGMKQQGRRAACTTAVFGGLKEERLLPAGSRLYAGDCVFETAKARRLVPWTIRECIVELKPGEKIVLDESQIGPQNKRAHQVLGSGKSQGRRFYLKTDRPVFGGGEYRLYVEIETSPGRNPIREGFEGLVSLELALWNGTGYESCRILKDETYQLLKSGEICFQVSDDWQRQEESLLRISVEDGEYDYPPRVSMFTWNAVEAVQKISFSESRRFEVLPGVQSITVPSRLAMYGEVQLYRKEDIGLVLMKGVTRRLEENGAVISFPEKNKEGMTLYLVSYESGFAPRRQMQMDGFPNQRIFLEKEGILGESLELMVECGQKDGVMEFYQRVENFHSSGTEDCHYVLDEETGAVTFGDGQKGKMPKGRLIITGLAVTQASRGNISSGQLCEREDSSFEANVNNRLEASGGREPESITQCFERFLKEQRDIYRCVTPEDYEQAVLGAPGLCIEGVKTVLPGQGRGRKSGMGENQIFLVVRPGSTEKMPRLSWGYQRNISRLLEEMRMLGSRIQLLSPEYIGISLFAEVEVKPHYKDAREQIEEHMQEYFRRELSGFGARLVYSGFYGTLDAMECVSAVRSLSVDTQGKDVIRSGNGDIRIPPNALVYLQRADYRIRIAE